MLNVVNGTVVNLSPAPAIPFTSQPGIVGAFSSQLPDEFSRLKINGSVLPLPKTPPVFTPPEPA